MMKAILLVAHGSRRRESNQEILALSQRTATLMGETFSRVEAAFLELAEPDIPTAINRCIEAGIGAITVVPYFLAPGSHVVRDIPAILEKVHIDHPHLKIEISTHIGASDLMPELIIRSTAS